MDRKRIGLEAFIGVWLALLPAGSLKAEPAETKPVLVMQTGPIGPVHSVAFSPDGKYALTGSDDKTANLWDLSSGTRLRSLQGHTSWIYAVAMSPDGKYALTGSDDKTAILWEVSSGTKLHTLKGHTDGVSSVAFSPDGKYALTGSTDKTPIVWEVSSGTKLRTLREGKTDGGTSVAFAPDGKHALTGGDQTAILWDVSSGALIRLLLGHTKWVNAVAFSPDGKYALTGSNDKTVLLWEVSSGTKLRSLTGHTDFVKSVAFSPDGKYALTGSSDKTAILWEVSSGTKLRSLEGHNAWVSSVAFAPDGKCAFTGSGDGTTRLWETATGKEVARLLSLDGGIDWAVITPEGLFDGSKGGRDKVSFRVGKGSDVVPLDRFFQDFYYPGLLAALYRGERPMPGKALKNSPAPTVKMLVQNQGSGGRSQEPGVKGQESGITIDVAVTDQGGGIRGPWLKHNGALLQEGGRMLKKEGNNVLHRFTVALVPGENRIDVGAASADGSAKSESAGITIPFDGKLPEPELHVLVVGINRFAKGAGVASLDYCVPDAKAMAELFQKRSVKLYKSIHLTQLLDDQATKDGILKAVTSISMKAKSQDTLVLYVASHGITIGQRYYMLPHDFEAPKADREKLENREAAVRQHGLPIDELGDVLARVPALKRVLIFDTDHSGSVASLAGKRQNPFAFRGATTRAQGVYILTATASDELAAETKELGHSILTYALLASAGAEDKGPLAGKRVKSEKESVDVLDWFRFARGEVPGLYVKYVGRPQSVELSGEDQPGFPLLRLDAK